MSSSLGPTGIVGGGSECTALSPPSIPWWGALEQGTEPPTAPRVPQHKWLPTALGVCSLLCMSTLDGLITEHKLWVWVTILGHMSRHFHFNMVICCLGNFLLLAQLQMVALLNGVWKGNTVSFFNYCLAEPSVYFFFYYQSQEKHIFRNSSVYCSVEQTVVLKEERKLDISSTNCVDGPDSQQDDS